MKPVKYSSDQTTKIDLGTKIIYKYPSPTKEYDIGRMVVNGRNPQGENTYFIESGCDFVIYVIKGSGKVFAGDNVYEVVVDDVVFVPKGNTFAVDGQMEYITVDVPAYYPEQSSEITLT